MSTPVVRYLFAAVACSAIATAPLLAQGITQPKQGQGGSIVTGSAGTDGSSGDKGLQHCDRPMGAMAVHEPQSDMLGYLSRYSLSSPVGLIRMMIQQSNCFIVVQRGVGMQNMAQELALASSGELRPSANISGG